MLALNRRALLGGVAALALGACSKQTEGTEEIHYGRDTCAKCGMVISDAHYAAEIRGGGDRALAKFDDVGCAVNWLAKKDWRDEAATNFWVMDGETGTQWLNAREAWYMAGAMTPMNYGFVAAKTKTEGALDYAAMQTSALAKG